MLSTSAQKQIVFFTFLIIVIAIALRFIHLDADTPSGLSWSAGLYVDEGYKTLSPRNLFLYGRTHWHPADTYPGWMNYSPLTQWPVYAAFKSLGLDITSARVVPILYFSLLMLVWAYMLRHRYPARLYYLGLFLLGIDATLFTFSRVALFEVPLSFFLYSLLLSFTLIKEETQKRLLPIMWIAVSGIAIAFLIKRSALIYVACIVAPVLFVYAANRHQLSQKTTILISFVFAFVLAALLALTYNTWADRIGISPLSYIYAVIDNPLLAVSPLLVIAGTLCAAHAIVYQSDLYLRDIFRLSLISMVVVAPLILSMFPYNPLRYYVPIAPAYILLIIEWFNTTEVSRYSSPAGIIKITIGIALLALSVMFIFPAFDLLETVQMRYVVIAGLVTVAILLFFRQRILAGQVIRNVMSLLVTLFILHNIFFISSFIISPSFAGRDMRKTVSEVVAEHEIIAGGWAPFLTLGTPIRSIYANTDFNPPSALMKIKPNYFMLSQTPTALETFSILNADENFVFGEPIYLGKYDETDVQLFPVTIDNYTSRKQNNATE